MKTCVLGAHGLIGSAFAKRLNADTYPSKDHEVIINMTGVTHLMFAENVGYHLNEAIQEHLHLLQFCERYGITYAWPSSALVYEKDLPFTATKKAMEALQGAFNAQVLGLRIFPVYGNEAHKGNKASPVFQWVRDMHQDKRPIVYGDGNQGRDFIHVDDVVNQVIGLIEAGKSGIYDIATGDRKRFNDIIATINQVMGKNLEPEYVPAPQGYSDGIYAQNPPKSTVTLAEGIKRVWNTLPPV